MLSGAMMMVAKLRFARDRIRKRDGKCEGRKAVCQVAAEAVAAAHREGLSAMSDTPRRIIHDAKAWQEGFAAGQERTTMECQPPRRGRCLARMGIPD
jgi:hypothetical protein